MDKKHSTITTYTPISDDEVEYTTESYWDEIASRKQGRIKKVKTSHKEFLSDILGCLDVIQQKQTKELILRVSVDKYYNPDLIVKEYVVRKENYGRRR